MRAAARVGVIVRRGCIACAFVAVGVAAVTADVAAQTPEFTHERPITPTSRGPQRLPVDLPLLRDAGKFRVVERGERRIAEGGLADLRLFDSAGLAVPYLIIRPPDAQPQWAGSRLLPIAATKTSSGFEADFVVAQRVDAIRVEGIPPPFLKRVTVEGSGDRTRWTLLAGEATLFDLPAERMRQIELTFPPGDYRYLRVVWDDANSARVPLPRAVSARRALRTIPAPETRIDVQLDRGPSEPGRSRYRLRLAGARLPIVAIELDVGGAHVFRQATVTESRFGGTEAAPVLLGAATLSRILRDGVRASNLRIGVTPPTESEIQLTIEDGSNPPLDIKRVSAILAEMPVIFFEHSGSGVVARYGNPHLEPPTYDLEAVRGSIDVSSLPEAKWGEPRVLVETPAASVAGSGPGPGAELDPGGFDYVRNIPDGTAGLVALQLDAAALAHSRGPAARFADVRVLDQSNRQMPYLLERRDEPLELPLTLAAAGDSRAAGIETTPGRQRSVYRVSLAYDTLPASTLVLETSARVFQRTVQIGFERPPDRRHRDAWFDVRSTMDWRHADRQTAPPPLSARLDNSTGRTLLIVVDEGDNAALPMTSARLLLPSYRLRFFRPSDASLRLGYGRRDLQLPAYDLALLAQQVMGAAAREVSAEPERGEPRRGSAPIVPSWIFWTLLGTAVLVLLWLIARLARNP